MKPTGRQLWYSRLLRSVFQIDHSEKSAAILLHLCPAAARACSTLSTARTRTTSVTTIPSSPSSQRLSSLQLARRAHSKSEPANAEEYDVVTTTAARPIPIRPLPVQCYGCGAFSQTAVPDAAGYYNPDRNAVKNYTGTQDKGDPRRKPGYKAHTDVVRASLESLGNDKLAELGLDPSILLAGRPQNERFGSSRFLQHSPRIYSTNNAQWMTSKNLYATGATI